MTKVRTGEVETVRRANKFPVLVILYQQINPTAKAAIENFCGGWA